MRARRITGWVVWLLLAALLYFFENNTGTRAVLAASVLLPLIPAIRRFLLAADESEGRDERAVTVKSFSYPEEEEPGDVRAWQPGDPVNRIHWKLTAKRGQLLVRQAERIASPEEKKRTITVREESGGRGLRGRLLPYAALMIPALLLLLLIPGVYRSAQALCNRLFDLSEGANSYVYRRFPVPEGQTPVPAALLLGAVLAALLAVLLLSGSRILALLTATGLVLFQVYFGLSFPAWANVALAALLALFCAGRPPKGRNVLILLGCAAAVLLMTGLLYPGTDARTEAASERVRDVLSEMALQISGAGRELPAGQEETRHTHTQSLAEGEGEARPDREYRLVTVEERQISMPRWIDYLRIAALLLLSIALIVLPFLPFLILNARQKKTLEAQKAFASENVSTAVCAIFRQVIAWLEAMRSGAGNLPYRDWPQHLPGDLPPEYLRHLDAGAALFEEAAYSDHPMGEDQRRQLLDLLDETRDTMLARADRRQKLRLKYKECLWIEKA